MEEIDMAFSSAKDLSKREQIYPSLKEYANNSPLSKSLKPNLADLRTVTGSEALKEAIDYCMDNDDSGMVFGLGVPDPKGIFGTTTGLIEKYGSMRIFDIPLSEHALTGIAIGCSITGMRPILIHQRLDFSLVSIDQIVNQAAKWFFMFNEKMSVPLVIRMIVGRG